MLSSFYNWRISTLRFELFGFARALACVARTLVFFAFFVVASSLELLKIVDMHINSDAIECDLKYFKANIS